MVSQMLQTAWMILCESAVFILFGFFIAGLMQVFLPRTRVIQYLSAKKPRSVFLASLIGLPLPLCSCSVLPAAVTLRKNGASRGATLSFLISTPETSLTSVLLTYSLMGPVMAIMRPVAACITAVVAGLVENVVDNRNPMPMDNAEEPDEHSCCSSSKMPEPKSCCASEKNEPSSCCSSSGDAVAAESSTNEGFKAGLRFAFVDLFDNIAGWVLLGVIAAAVIQALLPTAALQSIFGGSVRSMLLMVVLGVPLYVCAEGSTPIAAALVAQGISPGAALVLLLVGPATNIGAVGVLAKQIGKRSVVIYLVSIIVVALIMGGFLNNLLASSPVDMQARAMGESLVPAWLKTICAIGFLLMTVMTASRRRWLSGFAEWIDAKTPIPMTRTALIVVLILLLVGCYIGSGFFIVAPDEVAVVKRFGAVTRPYIEPGMHYTYPWPVGEADIAPVRRVERLTLGFYTDREGRITGAELPLDSWSLIGDENIVDIKSTIHYSGDDSRQGVHQYLYGAEDHAALVRSVVLGAAREQLGGTSVDRVFTSERQAMEESISRLAQEKLDELKCGLRLRGFQFIDAHAPSQVHEAFRDVAGAMEDKATAIDKALAEQAEIIPRARGNAVEQLEAVRGELQRIVCLANGKADAFNRMIEVYREYPSVTRLRLYFEMAEKVLPGLVKYVKPGGTDGAGVDFWFISPDTGERLNVPPVEF